MFSFEKFYFNLGEIMNDGDIRTMLVKNDLWKRRGFISRGILLSHYNLYIIIQYVQYNIITA